MTRLRVWLARAAGLFRRPGRDRALDDEIQAHLDDLTDDPVTQGMSDAEAIAEARRQFGGVARVKETYRDQRGWPSLDSLRHDVGLAGRLLRAQRGSTLLAVLTLGVGIGREHGLLHCRQRHQLPRPAGRSTRPRLRSCTLDDPAAPGVGGRP